MKRISWIVNGALLAALAFGARADAATTRYVSPTGSNSNLGTQGSPLQTITAAITASVTGDTVVLEDGTFSGPGNVNLDTAGRTLTITSLNGPSKSIIDCNSTAYALIIDSGEGQNGPPALFENITVLNAASTNNGGAIYLHNANATIKNCVIQNATGKQVDQQRETKGSIYNVGACTLTVTGCAFPDSNSNGTTEIYNNGRTIVSDCVFPSSYDCGIISTGDLTISGSTFMARIIDQGSHLSVTQSSFLGCSYSAISTSSIADISHCAFDGNSAFPGAGGALEITGTATVTFCTFTRNSSDSLGGAIYNGAGALTLTNCVFSGNYLMYQGYHSGGLERYDGSAVYSYGPMTAQFCTLYDNHAVYNGYPIGYGSVAGSISNSIFFKNLATFDNFPDPREVNPVFVDAPNGNLNIGVTSPYARTGTAVPGVTTDLSGVTRPDPPSQGAYEPVFAPAPTVTSISPAIGPVGTTVTITGTNLTSAAVVKVGGTQATSVTVVSPTTVTAVVGANSPSGTIAVTTAGGIATSAGVFTVTYPTPTMTSFSPAVGAIGTTVTIQGTQFRPETSVAINGVPMTSVTVVSPTKITAVVATGTTSGKVAVTNWGGLVTSSANFTVTNPPIMNGFSPSTGPVGTAVTILGANFTPATTVSFNGKPATSVSFVTPSKITAVVGAGTTTGRITVTTAYGGATSSAYFVVTPPPTLASFSPTSGPVGTTITITGANFIAGTTISINGTPASSVTVVSPNKITAVVAVGMTTGKVTIATGSGSVTSSAAFTVVYAAPIMSSFSPVSGPVGTTITINGANFITGASFKINGTAATSVTVVSSNKVTAVVAAGTTTGKVALTTLGGTVTSSASFKVTP